MTEMEALDVLKQRGLAAVHVGIAKVAIIDPLVPVWEIVRPALAVGNSLEDAVENYINGGMQ